MANDRTEQDAKFLNDALSKLDEWRHLPAYRLEPHVDIFFGLLLPEILEATCGLPRNNMEVIPEFPLHKGLIVNSEDEDGDDNQSIKVDFAVFHPGPDDQGADAQEKRVFLVELKTDNASIKAEQLERMQRARDKGVCTLLKGVVCCARQSNSKRKYAHLIQRLNLLGCIENFKEFNSGDLKKKQPGLAGRYREMFASPSWSDAQIELVLVYPGGDLSTGVQEVLDESPRCLKKVDFSKVVDCVDENPLTQYLVKWAKCEAGTADP